MYDHSVALLCLLASPFFLKRNYIYTIVTVRRHMHSSYCVHALFAFLHFYLVKYTRQVKCNRLLCGLQVEQGVGMLAWMSLFEFYF